MSKSQDELIRLLDGKIDAAELARNPTLASIADRVYGVKIDPSVKPKKARDLLDQPQTVQATQIEQTSNPMDLMVEYVADSSQPTLPVPQPMEISETLPSPVIPDEPVLQKKKRSIFFYFFGIDFIAVIANLFGAFSFLGGSCLEGDLCPVDGYTRLNLLDFWKVDTGEAWSLPITQGSYGIPDIVAISVLFILLMATIRKK